jgi:hypothetical protein
MPSEAAPVKRFVCEGFRGMRVRRAFERALDVLSRNMGAPIRLFGSRPRSIL